MPRGYESFEDVKCIAETDAAILCDFEDGVQHWVPKSQLSEDSEVEEKDDEGTLIVTRWWAEQKGLA